MKHRLHDARHTFIIKAKFYKVDEYILKIIVGHKIDDVTENVYTHRTDVDLLKEINKIMCIVCVLLRDNFLQIKQNKKNYKVKKCFLFLYYKM